VKNFLLGLLWLLLLTDATAAAGEKRDADRRVPTLQLFTLRYSFIPESKFVDPQDSFEEQASLITHQLDVGGMYPLAFKDGETVFLIGSSFNQLNFDFNRWPDEPSRNLYGFSLQAGLVQQLSPHWSAMMVALPGYYSDLETAENEAIDIYGLLLAIWEPNDAFQFGFGATYLSNFGEPLPLPALLLDWYLGRGFSLNALLPVSGQFSYSPHDRVILGLYCESTGSAYRMTEKDVAITKTDPSTGRPVTEREDLGLLVSYSVMSAGFDLKIRLIDRLYLDLRAGLATRRFELREPTYQDHHYYGREVTIQEKDLYADFSNLGDDYTWIAAIGCEISM